MDALRYPSIKLHANLENEMATYQERADEPKHAGHETERLGRHPLVAVIRVLDTVPVEDAEVAKTLDAVDMDPAVQSAKGREPGEGKEEVERIVHECPGEG